MKHELSLQFGSWKSHFMGSVVSMRIVVACNRSIVELRFQWILCIYGFPKPGVFGYPEREDSLQQPDHERRAVEPVDL